MAAGKTSHGCLKTCSCVTAIFLVIIAAVVLTLSFSIFKPKDPNITLHLEGVQNIVSSISMMRNVTLATVITIENQNYGSFKYRNSTAYVHYRGEVVGEAQLEERYVPARDKLNMTTFVSIMPGKVLNNSHFLSDVGAGSLNLTSTATLPGRMSFIKIFKKHATVYNRCNISIFIFTQSVESICLTKLKL